MLSMKTSKALKEAGFSIKKAQSLFVDACENAMIEIAGKGWRRKKDTRADFEKLEEEVRVPLCIDEDGPQFDMQTFRTYFRRSRKAMLFGITFTFADSLPLADLLEVKERVAKDKRRIPTDVKLKDAIRDFKAEKRKEQSTVSSEVGFIPIPRPGKKAGKSWLEEFKDALSETLSYPQVRKLFSKHPELKKIEEFIGAEKSDGRQRQSR